MSFFKIVISAILFLTVVHKGITNKNLDCMHGQKEFVFNIHRLIVNVSE